MTTEPKHKIGDHVFYLDNYPQMVRIISNKGEIYEILTEDNKIRTVGEWRLSGNEMSTTFMQQILFEQHYKIEELKLEIEKLKKKRFFNLF